MPEVPKIPVPTVEQINKFPWASVLKVTLGIIVALIIYILMNQSPKDCEVRAAMYLQEMQKAQQQTVAVLQENVRYQRRQDSIKLDASRMKDTISTLKTKISESVNLSKKAVEK